MDLTEGETLFNNVKASVGALVKWHKKTIKFYTENEPNGKRERADEQEEEKEEKVVKQKTAPAPAAITPSDFQCEGRLWEQEPCPGGQRSTIKAGILYEKKRHTVCKECKLAWERKKKADKKAN